MSDSKRQDEDLKPSADEPSPAAEPKAETRGAPTSRARTDSWFSPWVRISERADDGFVRVARSIGSAARFVETGVVGGIGKAGTKAAGGAEPAPRRPSHVGTSADRDEDSDFVRATPRRPQEREGAGAAERHEQPRTVHRATPPSSAVDDREYVRPRPSATEAGAASGARRPSAVAAEPPEPAPKVEPLRTGRRVGDSRAERVRATAPSTPPPPPPMPEPTPVLDIRAWLDEIAPDDAVRAADVRAAIDDWLNGSQDARRGALDYLVGLREKAEPFFIASVREGSADIAECALEGLDRIGSPRVTGCVSELLGYPEPEFRLAAMRVAQRLDDRFARRCLVRAVGDPSPMVRRQVIAWLGWRTAPWAIEKLWELSEDPVTAVRWAALNALVKHEPTEVRTRLLHVPPEEAPYARKTMALLSHADGEPASRTGPAQAVAARRKPAGAAAKKQAGHENGGGAGSPANHDGHNEPGRES
jgi:hypothetical protein